MLEAEYKYNLEKLYDPEYISDYYANNNVQSKSSLLREYLANSKKSDVPISERIKSFITFKEKSKPITISNKVKEAMDFFIQKGLTKEQAAGILGNLQVESNLNTTAWGDNNTSYGIAQWNKDRLDGLHAFSKIRNKPTHDFQTQLEYIWHELNTTERAALDELLKTNNPVDAARVFAKKFERMKEYNPKREIYAKMFNA